MDKLNPPPYDFWVSTRSAYDSLFPVARGSHARIVHPPRTPNKESVAPYCSRSSVFADSIRRGAITRERMQERKRMGDQSVTFVPDWFITHMLTRRAAAHYMIGGQTDADLVMCRSSDHHQDVPGASFALWRSWSPFPDIAR